MTLTGALVSKRSQETGIDWITSGLGKPNQNMFVESFNGRPSDECFEAVLFSSPNDARYELRRWRENYSEVKRPFAFLH